MTSWPKPNLMGVLNITPDSFSDGGKFTSVEAALAQAEMMVVQGAQIVDVGGESTRPGAERTSLETEQTRVLPVIAAITNKLNVTVSIDTMNSATARKAVEAGAKIVNDISGGLADPEMFNAIKDLDCHYVLGHWRGHSDQMDSFAVYYDVAREVVAELAEQVAMAVASGISRERIIVDPGLGFAKDIHQNWDLTYWFYYGLSWGRRRFLINAHYDVFRNTFTGSCGFSSKSVGGTFYFRCFISLEKRQC